MIKFYIIAVSAVLFVSNVVNAAPPPSPRPVTLNSVPANVQPAISPPPVAPSATPSKSPISKKLVDVSRAKQEGDDNINMAVNVDKKNEYQEVIDAYKTYLSTVNKDTIEEIRAYRIEMVKINKKKKALYKALSQEAQKYLAQEASMKRKLPVQKRKFSE